MITQIINFDIKRDSHITITAKQGDINARYLEFRLLDDSLPFSLVGRTVRAYIEKPDKKSVFNDLEIASPTQGYCLLELTSQTLVLSGQAKLELVIYESGKKLSTIPIKMNIIKSVNNSSAIESSDEFGVLDNALFKIDTFRNEMDSFNSQLEQKVNKEELNALGKLQFSGQYDTLEQLKSAKPTGAEGIFLVVADGYTYRWNGTEWIKGVKFQSDGIADESITSNKRTVKGEYGFIQLAKGCANFDFVNNKLVLPATVEGGASHEIIYRNNAIALSTGNEIIIDLTLEGGYARGVITFDIKTENFNVYYTSTLKLVSENEIILGGFHLSSKTGYLNCRYTIDGKPPVDLADNSVSNAKLKDNIITPSKVNDLPPMYKPVVVVVGGENLPIVNNNEKTLIFPQNIYDYIIYNGGVIYPNAIPKTGLTIDLSVAEGSSAWAILFNIVDKNFLIVRWDMLYRYIYTHCIFATFRIVDGKYNFNMPCSYIVDEKLNGYGVIDLVNKIIENPINANVKAVAHRGYSTLAPENTLPAYKLAKQKGFSYVECDIEWTKDEIPVLLHDGTIDRTSNFTGSVNTMTLSELKSYDFGSWKSTDYIGTQIPTFDEFILLCKKLNLHPYIELKGTITSSQANILANIVRKNSMIKNVSWISFSLTSLKEILKIIPNARVGYVGVISTSMIEGVKSIKTLENDVFIDTDYRYISDELMQTALMSDISIEVWTVDNQDLVNGLVEKGVSGITTNYLNIAEILYKQLITITN